MILSNLEKIFIRYKQVAIHFTGDDISFHNNNLEICGKDIKKEIYFNGFIFHGKKIGLCNFCNKHINMQCRSYQIKYRSNLYYIMCSNKLGNTKIMKIFSNDIV